MSEHTPGPWRWGRGSGGHDLPRLYGADDVVCHFGNDTTYYPDEGEPPSPADAALIAAAPDLLQACEALETKLSSFVALYPEMADSDDSAALLLARAAIAKATTTEAP